MFLKPEKQIKRLLQEDHAEKDALPVLKRVYVLLRKVKPCNAQPINPYFMYLVRLLPFRLALERKDYPAALHELVGIEHYELIRLPRIWYNLIDIFEKAGFDGAS